MKLTSECHQNMLLFSVAVYAVSVSRTGKMNYSISGDGFRENYEYINSHFMPVSRLNKQHLMFIDGVGDCGETVRKFIEINFDLFSSKWLFALDCIGNRFELTRVEQ